jgi:hypothetical protein
MTEQVPDADEWALSQLKPLGMFELAKQWIDAIKVIGAGNGASVVAAGAALNSFSQRHDLIIWVKVGGAWFLLGVFVFAFAFLAIHSAVFFYDEMLHATRREDKAAIDLFARRSTVAMISANRLAIFGAITFFLGCAAGVAVLIQF